MDTLIVRSITAGIFFGIWPLFMNKSGLPGILSSFVFVALTLVFILPFAIDGLSAGIPKANWWYALAAGAASAVGVLAFNGMLAEAPPARMSTLFVVSVLVQTSVPALYQVLITHGISWTRAGGFAFAALGAALLLAS